MSNEPPRQPDPIRQRSDEDDLEAECTGACLKLIAAGIILLSAIVGILTLAVVAIVWAIKHL